MDAQEWTIREARQACSAFGEQYANREQIAWDAFRAGVNRREIADRMGIARETIGNWITRRLQSESAPEG